jgi:hypothetical protein
VELLGRRKASVLAALARLRDRGAFIVTTEERRRSDGQRYRVDVYAIDPSGPFRGPE